MLTLSISLSDTVFTQPRLIPIKLFNLPSPIRPGLGAALGASLLACDLFDLDFPPA